MLEISPLISFEMSHTIAVLYCSCRQKDRAEKGHIYHAKQLSDSESTRDINILVDIQRTVHNDHSQSTELM